MQFILTAHDHPDALQRRMECRDRHLALGDTMRADGKLLYAAALLNEKQEMTGSMMVFEFTDHHALEDYLVTEPYVQGGVWDKIDVRLCKVGPAFVK